MYAMRFAPLEMNGYVGLLNDGYHRCHMFTQRTRPRPWFRMTAQVAREYSA
jgi:hypothetical protein